VVVVAVTRLVLIRRSAERCAAAEGRAVQLTGSRTWDLVSWELGT
jgi:hypothetical protein